MDRALRHGPWEAAVDNIGRHTSSTGQHPSQEAEIAIGKTIPGL